MTSRLPPQPHGHCASASMPLWIRCPSIIGRMLRTTRVRWWAWLLVLLLAASAARADDEFWDFRVERGDTLIGIRDRLLRPGADWRELQRVNRVANPRRLVPGSTLRIPVALLPEQALAAEVLHAHGEVSVQRPGGAVQRLAGGENLAVGDVLRTGPQSSAVLRFADGSRVLLRPDSVLRIERTVRLGASPVIDSRVRLESGSVDTQVAPQKRPRFEVRTPMANLGVRGTEFRTHTDAGQTGVEVLAGRVAAAGVDRTAGRRAESVAAGFGALASAQGIEAPRPLLAAPPLGTVPALVERLPLRLGWSASAGAAAYRAQVFEADKSDRLVLDGLFSDPVAKWSDDLPDGRYALRVRAVDGSGLEGFDASAAFRLKARPEPPFPTAPRAASRTGDETLVFAWTKNLAAERYRLQVADSADFATPRIERDDVTGTELRVPLPVGTHFWRLASIRADGDVGPWGDVQSVTRVALPPAPASEAAQTHADGVLLSWRDSAGARYQVQVARDAGFTQLLHDEIVDAPQWLLRTPEAGSYYVRVRTLDADGFAGPYGATQQVDVPRSPPWWLLLPVVLLLLL
jgi:hypothetical protein